MPTRILREGILTSERVNSLSTGAELFFRRLISVADDYGRFSAHPSLLRAALFPLKLDDVSINDIQTWLGECEKVGVLVTYSAEGKQLLEIPRFNQRMRSKKSKYPSPLWSVDSQMTGTCQADDDQVISICQTDDRPVRTNTNTNTNAEAESKTNNECEDERVPLSAGNGKLSQAVAEMLSNRKKESGFVFDRDDVIGSVERMVGPKEWTKNSRMWEMRARSSPESARALSNAVEDFVVRTPAEQAKIHNRAAWLTARYEQLAGQPKQNSKRGK